MRWSKSDAGFAAVRTARARAMAGAADLLPVLICGAMLTAAAGQFWLKAWSEVLEIAVFAAILAAYLLLKYLTAGVGGLLDIVSGSWTQRLAALYLVCLMVTFVWGDHSVRSALALLRLPTYLVAMALFVDAARRVDRMPALAWTMLVGISALFALVLVEFYLGSGAVGLECAESAKCVRNKQSGWQWEGLLSLDADARRWFAWNGGNLNASIVAEEYGISRLALFAVLSYACGLGLALTARRSAFRLLAGLLAALAVFTVLLSGSRSGLAGLAIVSAALPALHAVSWRPYLAPTLGVAAAALAAGALLSLILPAGQTALSRAYGLFAAENRLVIEGFASGGERLADPGGRAVVSHRQDGLDAGRSYELQLSLYAGGKSYVDDAIVAVAQRGDDRGSLVLTWYEPYNPCGIDIDYILALRRHDAAVGADPPWRRHRIVPTLRSRPEPAAPTGGLSCSSLTRPASADGNRLRNWRLALDLFAANPAGGSGFRAFQPEARRILGDTYTVGVHSGYLKTLSESGLLGFLPLLGLCGGAVLMLCRLRRRCGAAAPELLWRNVFLSVLVAFLALNLLDTHSSDRFFWAALAAAGAVEVWRRPAAAAAAN